MERFRLLVAVYLFLIKDDKILLLRRYNTGWNDGNYSLPAGHIDEGETASNAMVREAQEEIGVLIQAKDLDMVHVMHRAKERIEFFFVAKNWQGEPVNTEPDKCDDVRWFPLDNIPSNLIPSVKAALEKYQAGETFSEFGWE